MPTVEVVSVGATSGPAFRPLEHFALRIDLQPESDRNLFSSVLDGLKGVVVHLGDQGNKVDEPSWFCGHAIELAGSEHFYFPAPFYEEIECVVETMIHQSPEGKALFLTDCQYGPEHPHSVQLNSVGELSLLNDERRLRLNTLYKISE